MSELLVRSDVHHPYQAVIDALADPGWGVFPQFLPPAQVQELAKECRALWSAGGFRHAGVGPGPGSQMNQEIRGDRIMWLNDDLLTPIQRGWMDILDDLRLAINRQLFLGLCDFEGHFAVYPPGSFYRRHLDQFEDVGQRAITTVLYLNEAWQPEDGGQLRLLLGGEGDPHVEVAPEAGTLVTFRSDSVVHEVLPAHRERMSLTGWYRRRG
jgi:SM-20-related protein